MYNIGIKEYKINTLEDEMPLILYTPKYTFTFEYEIFEPRKKIITETDTEIHTKWQRIEVKILKVEKN